MRLQNKIVFITDADSDSGKTLISRFADEGAHFILNSTSDGDQIQSSIDHCRTQGSMSMIVNVDLCKSSEVRTMLEAVEKRLGTVDVLIHNNNVVAPTSVETCNEELFLQIMNENTKSAFICTQAVGNQMKAKQSGKIIYISSIHAEKPTGSSFAYSASKGAVKLLTREAALILGRYGVNVNTIEMGPIEGDDERFKSDISSLYDSYQFKVPNAILGSHDDLAQCALYLSSDEAIYMNGADIRLDGGFMLHYVDKKMKKADLAKEETELKL
ncbi:short-chain dehydrogenase [Bacillus sp. SA1-12]|uniref:SDR family NAD(P)-dependent oxidoreductase n=1 Tax=Bacillus sp. SA1-12 TaxID=1455638 RepID=UPI0006273383|nr:SDR family oxidoreductase [Bacillus sp. SA1-12]KKI89792.1 short-chain dehydrogenase [Bacillus sp. SA1-12]